MITDHFYVTSRVCGRCHKVVVAVYDLRVSPEPKWCDISDSFYEAELQWHVYESPLSGGWSELGDKCTPWSVRVDHALRTAQEEADQLNGMERLTSQSLRCYQEVSKEIAKFLVEAEAELAALSKAAMAKAHEPSYC